MIVRRVVRKTTAVGDGVWTSAGGAVSIVLPSTAIVYKYARTGGAVAYLVIPLLMLTRWTSSTRGSETVCEP